MLENSSMLYSEMNCRLSCEKVTISSQIVATLACEIVI